MRTLPERGHLAVPHLVQDPARIFVAEVVDACALARAELAQGRRGQFGIERQCLQAGEHAVATEHRHEPRQAGRGEAPAARGERRESQRGEVDEAAAVGPHEVGRVRLQRGRGLEPAVEIALHVGLRPAARPWARTCGARCAATGMPVVTSMVVFHSPCAGIVTAKVSPFSSYFAGSARGDGGVTPEGVPGVLEHEL